jgi:hypothetical protein
MKVKAWKIRNKETGEFSKGGTSTWGIWTKGGKTWTNIGHVKSHLRSWVYPSGQLHEKYPYHNAEIIEVEIDYSDCFTYPVNILVANMVEDKKEKAKKQKDLHEKWLRERELKLLEELKKKYE